MRYSVAHGMHRRIDMRPVVGVFPDRAAARDAAGRLQQSGFPPDHITVLSPGAQGSTETLPTTEGERSGVGRAVGAVVGTAVGAAAGFPLGAALTSVLVPGIGPVIAAGVLGAALLAPAGAAVGGAIETSLTDGVPKDDAFVYLEAVRRGRSVVVALAEDDDRAAHARSVLDAAGAESLDAAREDWWVGLRSAERERYVAAGHDFDQDEAAYRRGFQAALGLPDHVRSYLEAEVVLRDVPGAEHERAAFRRGVDRGLAYRESLRDQGKRAAA